jgi:uncharacterized lipoprotein YddW (UPF0748 family)
VHEAIAHKASKIQIEPSVWYGWCLIRKWRNISVTGFYGLSIFLYFQHENINVKKRKFIQVLGTGLIGATVLPNWANDLLSQNSPNRMNWIWIHGNPEVSDDAWKIKFDQMRSAGIGAALVQLYNGHTALFEHPNPLVPVKTDLLSRLIPIAHAAGVQLHAWMWSMPCNNPTIIEKHPDWFAVNGNGKPSWSHPAYVSYYKFLCPCHPGAREFVTQNVKAIAAYNELDGIHLDYIRLPDVILAEALQPKYGIVQDREYPEYDYSYSEYCRSQFKEQQGIDPLDLENPSSNPEWLQFRLDSITNLVNTQLVPAAKSNDKFISAAVFPNWQSVRQQWHNWDLDAFMPMLYHNFYHEDIAWIGSEIKEALTLLKIKRPVYAGLFVPSLSPLELKEAIALSRRAGSSGFSLFDFNALKSGHWEAMGEG